MKAVFKTELANSTFPPGREVHSAAGPLGLMNSDGLPALCKERAVSLEAAGEYRTAQGYYQKAIGALAISLSRRQDCSSSQARDDPAASEAAAAASGMLESSCRTGIDRCSRCLVAYERCGKQQYDQALSACFRARDFSTAVILLSRPKAREAQLIYATIMESDGK